MAKKTPGTGKHQDDEVEDEELDDVEDEELDETEDESETDDAAGNDADDEGDEEEEAEPTAEELKAQLAKVTRALKKANREAASRRIELDALKKKSGSKAGEKANGKNGDDTADDELRTLREQNEKLLAELRRMGARQSIAKAARRAKINWANDTARDDAVELILREAVINEDGTIDDVEDLLAEVVEDRPHLLAAKADKKPPRAGDTSATKRGGSKDLALDEDEIAQQFGIRDHRPTKK